MQYLIKSKQLADKYSLTGHTHSDYFSISGGTIYGDVLINNNFALKSNIFSINSGETSTGVTNNYAGFIIDRGSNSAFTFLYNEIDKNIRVGLSGNTNLLALRSDNLTNNGLVLWNNTTNLFSSSNLYLDSNNILTYSGLNYEQYIINDNNIPNKKWITTNYLSISGGTIYNDLYLNELSGATINNLAVDTTGKLIKLSFPQSYQSTGYTSFIIGTTVLDSYNTIYSFCNYIYSISDSGRTNMRSGIINITNNDTEVVLYETTTRDIGNTNNVTISADINFGLVRLTVNNIDNITYIFKFIKNLTT